MKLATPPRTTSRIAMSVVAMLVLALWAPSAFADEPKHVLKVASLAPKGSSWANSFEKTNRDIRKATDGEVALKLYPGGVMGDEGAMVRKMRTGQLDGAALTSVGLGDIAPELLVLQLPLTFQNYKQLDCVRDKMSDQLRGILEKKGFVLLHWGDVGFNYVFTNTPVATPGDIKKTKMWVWDADPISKKVMEVAGVNGTLLGVPDVKPSLSTGVIDAYSNSPYGAVALQWHNEATHVTNLRLAVVIGGLVVDKKSWEKIPAEHREAIMKVASANGKDLLGQIRKDNQKAISTIKKAGIEMVQPKDMNAWLELASDTREQLSGDLFPKELVSSMQGHLKTCR